MKSKYLFPTSCLGLGYFLAIAGFILGYLTIFKNYEIPGFGFNLREKGNFINGTFENFTNELAVFFVIIGLLFVAFSRDKKEDELMARLRLNSLYWSVMIYYIIYNFGFLLINTIEEIPLIGEHLHELNIFTPLLIFIIRFFYLKHARSDHFLFNEPRFLANKPFRLIGVALTCIGIIPMVIIACTEQIFSSDDLIFTIAYFIMVFGLLIWSFSKNKIEDEGTMQQRLESLQLSVYFNYLVLLAATLLFYSLGYLFVLMFAQFSLLLFFVIRMEYVRYSNTKILNTFEGGIGA